MATSSSPPNWAPHDHGNPGNKPVMWLDVLDMPTVNHFETSFAEHSTRRCRTPTARMAIRSSATARACCRTARRSTSTAAGHQLSLCAHAADPGAPEEDGRHRQASWRARALRQSDQRRLVAADHGRASRAAAEGLQGRALPLDRRHHLRCAPKARARPRSTARPSSGASNDVFVVPPWKRYSHTVDRGDAVLFSISDRPAQEALGIWREGN